jgi:hypothetical protein
MQNEEFDDFDTQVQCEEVYTDFLWEADLSQYDDDPSPYDGTYSEE